MQLLKPRIIDKIIFSENLFLLVLENLSTEPLSPGQFFAIKVIDSFSPLLRRPFSIFDTQKENISFLIQVKGKGTKLLKDKKIGDALDILGPLGKPYLSIETPFLIAGGTGIAPLNFYARFNKIKGALWGLRTKPNPRLVELIKNNIPALEITTEDGSSGRKGLVTDYIPLNHKNYLVCGPTPMIEKILQILPEERTWVSLEGMMGCGFGVCMGCAVKKRKEPGYYRICTEGPLFRADSIMI